MKLLGCVALLFYVNHASAACSDNERRNHCLAETDCVWLRSNDPDVPGGGGKCKNSKNVECDEVIHNKKLCNKRSGCHFNIDTKECVERSNSFECSDMTTRKACKGFGGCWYNRTLTVFGHSSNCKKDSFRDNCNNFYYFRWGCHNKARGDCVYSTVTGQCLDSSIATCADFNDNRSRCNNSLKGCKYDNKTGDCNDTTAPTNPAQNVPDPRYEKQLLSFCKTDADCLSEHQCLEHDWVIVTGQAFCLQRPQTEYSYDHWEIGWSWNGNSTTDTYQANYDAWFNANN